jgi:hypothetical protein
VQLNAKEQFHLKNRAFERVGGWFWLAAAREEAMAQRAFCCEERFKGLLKCRRMPVLKKAAITVAEAGDSCSLQYPVLPMRPRTNAIIYLGKPVTDGLKVLKDPIRWRDGKGAHGSTPRRWSG